MSFSGFDLRVAAYLQARHWYVAFSGGLDSHVLLVKLKHYLSIFSDTHPDLKTPSLIAVHINHQLQPESEAWEQHCIDVCNVLSVPIITKQVDISGQANIEALARAKRYEFFDSLLETHDVVFMGHHQNDQLETFFYRLFRGSGIQGLTSIPYERALGKGVLSRPFLDCSKEIILHYAIQKELKWVEDPTNQYDQFDRNYIRLNLLPIVLKRWPSFSSTISRLIRHSNESAMLMNEVAEGDLSVCKQGVDSFYNESWLNCEDVLQFSLPRQKNVVRFYLKKHSLILSDKQIDQLFAQIIQGRKHKAELSIAGVYFRCFKDCLYLCYEHYEQGAYDRELSWLGMNQCSLPNTKSLSLSSPLDIRLTVRFRRGGERGVLPAATQRSKLKNLLQDYAIPWWRRDYIPLVYCEGVLIAVADLIYFNSADQVLKGRKILYSSGSL